MIRQFRNESTSWDVPDLKPAADNKGIRRNNEDELAGAGSSINGEIDLSMLSEEERERHLELRQAVHDLARKHREFKQMREQGLPVPEQGLKPEKEQHAIGMRPDGTLNIVEDLSVFPEEVQEKVKRLRQAAGRDSESPRSPNADAPPH